MKGQKSKKEQGNVPLVDQWNSDFSQISQRVSSDQQKLDLFFNVNKTNEISGILLDQTKINSETAQTSFQQAQEIPKLQSSHSECLSERNHFVSSIEKVKSSKKILSLSSEQTSNNSQISKESSNTVRKTGITLRRTESKKINSSQFKWVPQNIIKQPTEAEFIYVPLKQHQQQQQQDSSISFSQSKIQSSPSSVQLTQPSEQPQEIPAYTNCPQENLQPKYLLQKVRFLKKEETIETCIMKKLVAIRKRERLSCFDFTNHNDQGDININNDHNLEERKNNSGDKRMIEGNFLYYNLIDGGYLELIKQSNTKLASLTSAMRKA